MAWFNMLIHTLHFFQSFSIFYKKCAALEVSEDDSDSADNSSLLSLRAKPCLPLVSNLKKKKKRNQCLINRAEPRDGKCWLLMIHDIFISPAYLHILPCGLSFKLYTFLAVSLHIAQPMWHSWNLNKPKKGSSWWKFRFERRESEWSGK